MSYFRLFSNRFGMSSSCLYNYFYTGDILFINHGFRAYDFDDWCRCLHKMSFMTVTGLSYRLQKLQNANTPYNNLIYNLAQSVYLCLLYWYVKPDMLLEFIRKASMSKSKYIDILSVYDLCHIREWISIPTGSFFTWNTLHKGACAQVFSSTFDAIMLHRIDLYVPPCCTIPNVCMYFKKMWLARSAIKGKKVDMEKVDVIMKTL